MTITETPSKVLDTIVIDLVGPLPPNKLLCELSKYLITALTSKEKANSIARVIFENIILTHDPIKMLKYDRSSEFRTQY